MAKTLKGSVQVDGRFEDMESELLKEVKVPEKTEEKSVEKESK